MAYNPEPLSETSVIKFNDQDFHSLRDRCLQKHLHFEDETFPAEASSIGGELLQGKNLSNLEWKRPWVRANSLSLPFVPPHFILDDASRFDIEQGIAGDCWFLAALGSLTQNPQCLQKILMDQSFSHQYAGIFRFRFWQYGQWVEVVVDDRLPTIGRDYLFVRPRKGNQEFWPCLLEKAYAKLRGSYSNLHYGYIENALVDLTGGVVTTVNLHSSPSDLLMAVKMAAETGSLMTCATPNGPTAGAQVMKNGLVSQHAYTVTGAEKIQYKRGWEEIIRLWNPWGKTEWRGRWGDGSREWQETRDRRKIQLYENKEDGEFWMSCQDFQENFSCLFICNQFPITLDHGITPHERWHLIMFKNQVLLGNTTGAPRRETQYFFDVSELMRGHNVVVSFTVRPQSLKAEDENFPIRFQVFKVRQPFQQFQERLPPTFFSPFRHDIQGIEYEVNSNFTKSFHLIPGHYVVVPSAPREKTEYLLRIFLKMPDSDRYRAFGILRLVLPSSPGNGLIPMSFLCSNQGLDIDATQLQNLLNQELLTGMVSPRACWSQPQPDTPPAATSLKVDGRLDQEEFGRLWRRLVHCQVWLVLCNYHSYFIKFSKYLLGAQPCTRVKGHEKGEELPAPRSR
uniref:Calpain 13 n=1 Tax=Marmota marmota marmota TaxID=9994 RepID=A0A8C5ZYV7_MARMA